MYFTFRFNVSVNTVDCHAPKKSLPLEFSLCLPKSLSSSTLSSTSILLPVPTSPSVQAPSQPVADLAVALGNLSDDILSGIDPAQLCKLVINARDTITNVPFTHIQSIAPSNIFSAPQFLFPTALTSSSIPKMDQVRSIVPSGGVITFTGSSDFLDSQSSINTIFGDNSTILSLTPSKKKQCVTENMEYLHSKVDEFCNLCHLRIFCDSVHLNMLARMSMTLAGISLALSKLQMVSTVRGKKMSLTPDDLFDNFTVFIPLLSHNTMTW